MTDSRSTSRHSRRGRRDERQRRLRHRRTAALVVVAVGAAALVAILGFPTSDGGPDGGEIEDAVEVSMVEYAFVPSEIVAAPGQAVSVVNDGAIRHSLLVVGLGKGVELAPGDAATFRLPDDADGTYRVICDLPGHEAAGQVGTLTVG